MWKSGVMVAICALSIALGSQARAADCSPMSVRASMPTRANRTLSRNAKQQGNAVRKQVFMLGPLVAYLMKCTNVCALGAISPTRLIDDVMRGAVELVRDLQLGDSEGEEVPSGLRKPR